MPLDTLLRYAPSTLLLAVAAYVWSRADGADVLVLTGLEHLVGPDPRAQADATWQLLGGVGLVSLGFALARHLRDRRLEDIPEDAP